MLITSAVIANLYTRYCDYEENECREDAEAKFTIFPVFGFFIMVIWVSSIREICDCTHTELLLHMSKQLGGKSFSFLHGKIVCLYMGTLKTYGYAKL